MSSELVTLTCFSFPLEANLLRAALEDNGIQAVVVGDEVASTMGGVAGLPAAIRVLVAADMVPRARKVLRALEQDRLDERWEASVADSPDVWLCDLCGEPNATTLAECPYCRTARPSAEEGEPGAGPAGDETDE